MKTQMEVEDIMEKIQTKNKMLVDVQEQIRKQTEVLFKKQREWLGNKPSNLISPRADEVKEKKEEDESSLKTEGDEEKKEEKPPS